ncbi:VOC family protein [Haloechinothrix halophila]|uniref:VOC family protein n=1 Tax=Haloechinothrix halophila TaxID=1069073 RepID=UPI0003F610CF|nr:VOC family protein [Haloechinothrix halophila]
MPKPIPDNYPRMMPHVTVQGAAKAIEFYTEVFGATQRGDVFTMPDGSVAHAELQIGDSVLMLADENPEFGNTSPKTVGGTPVTMMIYVEDVDATVEKAVSEGATLAGPVSDEFYGDRVGRVTDPFGHMWHVASHIEDVSDEEMAKRASDMLGG